MERVKGFVASVSPGTVFTPAELVRARLGSEQAIRQALGRLAAANAIRRVAKGYYDVPRVSDLIGELSPTPDAIIAAHARKTGGIIEPSVFKAANLLNLSLQVPARVVYRTNLSPRELHIGGQRIQLKAAGPRSLARDNEPADLVIDALRAIGRRNITSEVLTTLRRFVQDNHLGPVLRERANRAASWMLPHIDTVLADE